MAVATERVRTESAARAFRVAAWGVLGWNTLVVLWGAFVRATGSGAGCGGHWPLCNGSVVPQSPGAATIIEFTHRLSSGIALIGVFTLAAVAWRVYPRYHAVRRWAAWGAVFIVTEALLGAGLVLFDYVAHNASVGRVVYLSLHLVNTQLLLGALAATAWFANREQTKTARPNRLTLVALATALVVSVTGAIAALGDTLFPVNSLAAGFQQDFSTTSGILLRLRLLHPALAIAAGAFFLWIALRLMRPGAPSHPAMPGVSRASVRVLLLVFAQLCVGALNIALLAPVAMQLAHLLLADILWIALIQLTLETREARSASQVPGY